MNSSDERHLKALLRHIEHVRDACLLLGERIIESGKENLGIRLIANGQIHDCSKFWGEEWTYLRPEIFESDKKNLFEMSQRQHVSTNPHHPEYWGGIDKMPDVYLAEMVCDWYARSQEQGNDLRGWIKDKATKKFGMKVQSKVYKEIKHFVDILLDPSFK
jgi:hypothetical protein